MRGAGSMYISPPTKKPSSTPPPPPPPPPPSPPSPPSPPACALPPGSAAASWPLPLVFHPSAAATALARRSIAPRTCPAPCAPCSSPRAPPLPSGSTGACREGGRKYISPPAKEKLSSGARGNSSSPSAVGARLVGAERPRKPTSKSSLASCKISASAEQRTCVGDANARRSSTCTPHEHCMCTACAPSVHRMCMCMCTACTLHMHTWRPSHTPCASALPCPRAVSSHQNTPPPAHVQAGVCSRRPRLPPFTPVRRWPRAQRGPPVSCSRAARRRPPPC